MTAALLLAAALLQAPEPPRTLRAGPGEAYPTPAAALAAARPGDTVRVARGVHAGALALSTPGVVLLGEPGAVIDGGRRGTAVTVSAHSVTVRGLVIRESGRSLDTDDAAVKVVRADGCTVAENRIERSLHGVYLQEADGARVASNTIVGDTALAEARRGNAVHLFDSHGGRVERNTITLARDGIYFAGAGRNVIAGNDVSRVRYGVHYMYSDDNVFAGNRFTRNAAGAAIMQSRRITFRDNVFADHVGYRAYGILLQTGEEVTAERNRIEGNLTGVFLDASARNVFRENAIVGNGVGIDLLASSEDNLFAGNAIAGNRVAVRKVMGSGENRWAEDGRGNYWGPGAAFDLDGDGVGDRPHRAGDAFASLAAGRPVLEVWVGTPAARALSWAEEAFPVFDTPRVEDPHPLVAPPPGVPSGVSSVESPPRVRTASLALFAVPLAAAAFARTLRRRRRADPSPAET